MTNTTHTPDPAAILPVDAATLARRAKLNKAIGNAKFQERLGYLYSRWQDEGQYEDFKEYGIAMHKASTALKMKGLTFVKATKRPFGLLVELEAVQYQIGVNASSIYFKRA